MTLIKFSFKFQLYKSSLSIYTHAPQEPRFSPDNQQPLWQQKAIVLTWLMVTKVRTSGRLKITFWHKLCFNSRALRWNDLQSSFPWDQTEGHQNSPQNFHQNLKIAICALFEMIWVGQNVSGVVGWVMASPRQVWVRWVWPYLAKESLQMQLNKRSPEIILDYLNVPKSSDNCSYTRHIEDDAGAENF